MKMLLGFLLFTMCLGSVNSARAFTRSKSKETIKNEDGSSTIVSNGKGNRVYDPDTNQWITRSDDSDSESNPRGRPGRVSGHDKCEVFCSGSAGVVVDLSTHCMCTGPGRCFKVQTTDPSRLTVKGSGRISADVKGTKFQTKSPGQYSSVSAYEKDLTSLNNDALRMGIPGNDKYGRWIHKSYGCGPGGQPFPDAANAGGCIGVPCQHWPEIKAKAGSSLKVCESAKGQGGSQKAGATNGTK